jgi:hypothetical protein
VSVTHSSERAHAFARSQAPQLLKDADDHLKLNRKDSGYSVLNIIGLFVGTACFILIFLWLQNGSGYDRLFETAGHISRVSSDVNLRSEKKRLVSVTATGINEWGQAPWIVAGHSVPTEGT